MSVENTHLIAGRVSIGIPTYNRAALAERAARSVLSQTYSDIELVVSDDLFPGDDSENRIERLDRNGKLIRIVRQSVRLGLVGNFDACLRLATGEYFLLLGDDDVLAPEAIAELVCGYTRPPATAKSKDVGMVWCPCEIADADGKVSWTTSVGPPVEAPATLLAQVWAGNRGPRLSSLLFRTADLLGVGGFQQKYGDLCDLAAWGKVALAYPSAVCVPRPMVRYTNHPGSTTSQSAIAEWRRVGLVAYNDLVSRSRELGNREAERTLQRARGNFLASIAPTILVQILGGERGLLRAIREVVRSPHYFLTPLVFRRALKDGWKLLRLRK